ncbi:MAG: UDP-N-acetylmuramoyl-L-alanine--D-glutamate ligase [Lentisphaerae bacterium]|nr:UDP-N-acetylmuramoyl-L-alanine--D-glutamate ligase [Lentisphaerota bacterium]
MRRYKSALVLGLGVSGEAAARLLLAEGTRVVAGDCEDSPALRRRAAALQALGAEVALGTGSAPPGLPARALASAGDFEVAIVSPGIPATAAVVKATEARGIPVLAELELGWSRAAARVLAISGSNGKSTLVKLCAEALALAGQRVAVAGNYGVPVSAVIAERRQLDWLVLEVSSFQLETVRMFRPDVGVLLNLWPNHIDRHGDFQQYSKMKARLFAHMTSADTGVVEQTILPEIKSLAHSPNRWIAVGVSVMGQIQGGRAMVGTAPRHRAGQAPSLSRLGGTVRGAFGERALPLVPPITDRLGVSPTADCFYQSGVIHNSISGEKIELRGTMFDNEVMGLTAAAALAALSACGVNACHLAAAVRAFQPLPHRLQDLGAVRGIRFVNDSKATNLAAMLAALSIMPGKVRLIAGGLPKGESYEPARELLAAKAAAVYLIGQSATVMEAAWRESVRCVVCGTLESAFASAWKEAKPGETILLAPACASFDQFRSFAERGERFMNLIHALAVRPQSCGGNR